MQAPSRDHARAMWRQLALRYQWQLVDDEEALLDQVLALHTHDAETLHTAMYVVYSQRLFAGMLAREERAAFELWLLFTRLAARGGATADEVSDLAQEAVARVLGKLSQVQTPRSFIAWAMLLFRTTQRDLRPKHAALTLVPDCEDGPTQEPVDLHDFVSAVEQRLFNQELRQLLQTLLPNELERLALLRCIIFDEEPREVACDLGLPSYRVRVAKSRALQRLRTNDAFVAWLNAP